MTIAIGFIYGFSIGFEINPDRESEDEAFLVIDLGIARVMFL
jgi:hypothetical protein